MAPVVPCSRSRWRAGAVKSADRSLALLESLAGRPEGLTFAEIARALSLPRGSAHGLLQTLRFRGYLEAEEVPGQKRTAWACA